MPYRLLCIVSLLVLLIFGSCVSKRLTKKGAELEQAGMISEASGYYYRALERKNDNIDAKVGLKRTAQVVLDNKLKKFKAAYNNDLVEQAVDQYNNAKNYHQRISRMGVNLAFPREYNQYYREVKNTHLADKYKEGYKLLQEERFGEAEAAFNEIIELEPDYKNVKDLNAEAHNEPRYRQAKEAMYQEKYRKAYDLFSEILLHSGDYKSAESLKAKALEKGKVTIAMLPPENRTRDRELSSSIQAKLESRLTNLSNPFIQLIDRTHDEEIMREQRKNISSAGNGGIGFDPTKYKGAKALLTVELNNMSIHQGELDGDREKGYLKQEYKAKDPETGKKVTRIRYEKVYYKEYSQENSVRSVVSFKLISTETGEVLTSGSYSVAKSDEIHFADFDGDKGKLVPGYWKYKNKKSEDDEIKDKFFARLELNSLLKGRREIRTIGSLQNDALNEGADRIATKINLYNPE
ncbi:MAG: hypothetical protein K9I94_15375 [Bacteroidales bacterium]|nr:hypothetical protein [Bacteroidales bacterium]